MESFFPFENKLKSKENYCSSGRLSLKCHKIAKMLNFNNSNHTESKKEKKKKLKKNF